MPGNKVFGQWLRRCLVRMDLNITGLAHLLGVSQPAVSDWINAKSIPSDENLRRLAEILNVPIRTLYVTLGRLPATEDDIPEDGRWVLEAYRSMSPDRQKLLVGLIENLVDLQMREVGDSQERADSED